MHRHRLTISAALLAATTATSLAQNREITIGQTTFEMVEVAGGSFMMGAQAKDTDADSDYEKPVHKVTLSDFYMGALELTQGLWFAVMEDYPETMHNSLTENLIDTYLENNWFDKDLPMFRLSLQDAMDFVGKLNEIAHAEGAINDWEDFDVPTEAQWEYAARGGQKSQGYIYAGSDNYAEVAISSGNARQYAAHAKTDLCKGGQLKPNELGIYDMSGNMEEWCKDLYNDYSADEQTDPVCVTQKWYHTAYYVMRGGKYSRPAVYTRSTCRGYQKGTTPQEYQGMRLVLKNNGKPVPPTETDPGEKPTGITGIAGNVVKTETFALNGQRVADDAKGLVIRRTTMEGGSVKTQKEVRK